MWPCHWEFSYNIIHTGENLSMSAMIWNFSTLYEPRHNKTNKVTVRPAKTQISLGIHPIWSESLLCAQWVAKDPSFLHADSEDSDQTGWMPRLIWVFAGHTLILLVLSCRGSYVHFKFISRIHTFFLSTICKAEKKMSCFLIDPTFLGPTLNLFGTSENFSYIFRVFWTIFMLFPI